MKTLVLILFVVGFFVLNIFLKPEDSSIRPSHFYVNPLVSGGVWHYRRQDQVDYLILGNSRAKDGLDPAVIQGVLKGENPSVRVQAISTGGGYFPFYYEFLKSTVREKLPKNVILALSPRDFNKNESRIFNVSTYLASSYGYKLDRKPYNDLFKTVERNLTNFFAAVFPVFYYETHIKKILFNRKIESSFLDQNVKLKKYVDFLIGLIPKIDFVVEKSFYEYAISYFEGIRNVFNDQGPSANIVREDGYQVPPFFTVEEYAQRREQNKEKWARIKDQGDFIKYRTSTFCDSEVQLEVSPQSYLHRTFKFLKENNINVYVVQLPALWLEGCENNLKFGVQISNYLVELQKQYPNIIDIIDLNQNFNHSYSDIDIYADLEHIYPKNAALVSKPVAERILSTLQK